MSKADSRRKIVRRCHPSPADRESTPVGEMLADWRNELVYVDNAGNYRYAKAAGPALRGKITPWNREAERRFRTCTELHYAAREAEGYPYFPENHQSERNTLFEECR